MTGEPTAHASIERLGPEGQPEPTPAEVRYCAWGFARNRERIWLDRDGTCYCPYDVPCPAPFNPQHDLITDIGPDGTA